MRFLKHLKKKNYNIRPEKNKSKAKTIINRHLKEVKSKIDAHFTVFNTLPLRRFCMFLSSIYGIYGIRFIDDGEFHINKKYVKGYDFYMNGDIEIHLNEIAAENYMDLLNKGRFLTEVIDVLSKAMAAVQKVTRLKDEFNFVGYEPIRRHIINNIDTYIETIKQEIEEDGFSSMKSICFDLIGKHPSYKKIKEI